jgi:hypothetical protein
MHKYTQRPHNSAQKSQAESNFTHKRQGPGAKPRAKGTAGHRLTRPRSGLATRRASDGALVPIHLNVPLTLAPLQDEKKAPWHPGAATYPRAKRPGGISKGERGGKERGTLSTQGRYRQLRRVSGLQIRKKKKKKSENREGKNKKETGASFFLFFDRTGNRTQDRREFFFALNCYNFVSF